MNVFVASIPKSGTYLVSSLLTFMGFQQSGYHFVQGGISYYPPNTTDMAAARRNPGAYACKRDRRDVLDEVRATPGMFVVGHVPVSWHSDLSGFRLLFPIRDLRESLISRVRNLAQTGRLSTSSYWSDADGEQILFETLRQRALGEFVNVLKYSAQWAIQGHQPQLDFQNMVGGNGTAAQEKVLRQLTDHLDEKPLDVEEFRRNVLGCETLTGMNGDHHIEWSNFWSDRVQAEFQQQGLDEINRALGY